MEVTNYLLTGMILQVYFLLGGWAPRTRFKWLIIKFVSPLRIGLDGTPPKWPNFIRLVNRGDPITTYPINPNKYPLYKVYMELINVE